MIPSEAIDFELFVRAILRKYRVNLESCFVKNNGRFDVNVDLNASIISSGLRASTLEAPFVIELTHD